jgi:hypothetical protein
MKYPSTILAFFMAITVANTQEKQTKRPAFSTWEGALIIGYVNNGSFVNFGGPSIKLLHKPYTVSFGLLPSLRIKEDKVTTGQKRNSAVTPTSGFGLTFGYKHLAIQLPMYYNTKNSLADGKWNLGIGLGYKF